PDANGKSRHELYLMYDDIGTTPADLRGKGAALARDVSIRAGPCSPQSTCQIAQNSPAISPAPIALSTLAGRAFSRRSGGLLGGPAAPAARPCQSPGAKSS